MTDTINEKDPIWRDAGKSFVDSVTKLLERLLDYRDVLKVEDTYTLDLHNLPGLNKSLGCLMDS